MATPFKILVVAKYSLNAKAHGFKGAKWVKPSFDETLEALQDEEEERSDAELTKEELEEVWHLFKVKTFTPSEAKKIDVSDPGNKVPKKWLTDPSANPDYSMQHRYNPRHHVDVIPALRDGGELDMPLLVDFGDGKYRAMGGRHRVVYCINLGLPLNALVIRADVWYKKSAESA